MSFCDPPFQGIESLRKGSYQSSFLNDHDFLISSYSKLKFSLKKTSPFKTGNKMSQD